MDNSLSFALIVNVQSKRHCETDVRLLCVGIGRSNLILFMSSIFYKIASFVPHTQ